MLAVIPRRPEPWRLLELFYDNLHANHHGVPERLGYARAHYDAGLGFESAGDEG